jgi:hypothetical protein
VAFPTVFRTRVLTDAQQDLASLTFEQLRAYLAAVKADSGISLTPVLALSQVALTGGPLISKTYAREEWLDLVRAGRAFNYNGSKAAGVGVQSTIQLYNPAASGVRALVFGGRAYTSTALAAGSFINVALSTNTRSNPAGSGIVNLLNGGAAPACVVNQDAQGGPPADAKVLWWQPQLTAFVPVDLGPILSGAPQGFFAELPPGSGLSIWPDTVNISLFAQLLWAEVPLTY